MGFTPRVCRAGIGPTPHWYFAAEVGLFTHVRAGTKRGINVGNIGDGLTNASGNCHRHSTGMQNSNSNSQTKHRRLGLWDTVSMIVGIVIGAGIYETAPLVFQNVSGPGAALAVWVGGGLLTLVGALCYAELASTYPRSGGDYVYLSRAYGSWAGFLFGWAQLAVLMTGSIGMMAYIFSHYAVQLWSLSSPAEYLFAVGAVLVLSLLNLLGLTFGKRTQNALTMLKVLGISAILVAGFASGSAAPLPAAAPAAASGSIGLALILVLYTYGGWNDAAFVTAEVHNNGRNIVRALIFGTGLIALIYLLINLAYIFGLGFNRARESSAIAADLLALPLGAAGAKAMSLLVMISALGAINGMIYTGSRVYSTLGEDYSLLRPLARRHAQTQAPICSLVWQAAITIALITLVGTSMGRQFLSGAWLSIGLPALDWQGHGGFGTLLRATAPVFWFLFLLTGISIFVLRRRDAGRPRPFSVPLYPLLPLIFCATCAWMLYSSVVYAGQLLVLAALPVAAGLLVYLWARRPVPAVPAVAPKPLGLEQL